MARIERGDAFEDFDDEDTREEAEGEDDPRALPPPSEYILWDDWEHYDMADDWDGGEGDAYPGSFAIVASVTLA